MLEEIRKRYGGWTRYSVSHRSRKNTIGIEIEFDATRKDQDDRQDMIDFARQLFADYGIDMEVESDASLNTGAELVVHPITLDHLKLFSAPAFITLFSEFQKRGWNNDTNNAGGHMSVGRRSFGRSAADQDINLHKLHTFLFNNRNNVQQLARRNANRFAEWIAPENRYSVVDGRPTLRRVLCRHFDAIEYKDTTVQFRFFSAHLAFDQLLARYEFLQMLVQTFNGDIPVDLTTLTWENLFERNRRSKPNAYREYIATKDR